MTAYEELKAWCEKNIGNHYKGDEKHCLWNEAIINYTGDDDCNQPVIYIENALFVFDDEGNLDCIETMEHLTIIN